MRWVSTASGKDARSGVWPEALGRKLKEQVLQLLRVLKKPTV
jgi:hypothetical protein